MKSWITSGKADDGYTDEIVLGNKGDAEKVLGTVWHPEEDEFSFNVKDHFSQESSHPSDVDLPQPVKLTKRLILSRLAGIFDPIGVAAAVIVKSKIAMQELAACDRMGQ